MIFVGRALCGRIALSLDRLYVYDNALIKLGPNTELDETVTITGNPTFESDYIFDSNNDTVTVTPSIFSTAAQAFALEGNVTVTFTNVNITVEGTAFVYDGVSTATAVYLKGCTLSSEQDTEGMIAGNIFDNDETETD